MKPCEHMSFDQHELVVTKRDEKSGLRAIIAIHNTSLGPAIGGCRMFDYASEEQALDDVLRLSRGMTYKSALAGLPLGGGKSVIIGDPENAKTPELLRAMGDFLHSLGGRYIAAEDSGTNVSDMKVLMERTPHISGVLDDSEFGGDPSPYTAYGVYKGVKAALKYRCGNDCLGGISVAIQGAGSVGFGLAKLLLNEGAKVFVADINQANLGELATMGARVVSVNDILFLDVDVLAPCAMGSALNEHTVHNIKAGIVAGGANNQLATPAMGELLRDKGILYAPDFVINAGGIIDIYYQREAGSSVKSKGHIDSIYDTLLEIFYRADEAGIAPHAVAEMMAEERLRVTEDSIGTVAILSNN
jgi:leucine dehydrogenase